MTSGPRLVGGSGAAAPMTMAPLPSGSDPRSTPLQTPMRSDGADLQSQLAQIRSERGRIDFVGRHHARTTGSESASARVGSPHRPIVRPSAVMRPMMRQLAAKIVIGREAARPSWVRQRAETTLGDFRRPTDTSHTLYDRARDGERAARTLGWPDGERLSLPRQARKRRRVQHDRIAQGRDARASLKCDHRSRMLEVGIFSAPPCNTKEGTANLGRLVYIRRPIAMRYRHETLIVAAAIAVAGAGSVASHAGPAPDPIFKAEKCYGVNAAGKNDCSTRGHSCAGDSKVAMDPHSWIYVPVGTCTKIAGGSTTPKQS